ncbi:ABC transporter ATP-binding protein [Natribacillus halophilus]|uniref:Carnitine transport ATP-binding protein OpuCA n=1 Tax=Natribacillus halophilus TaxID=549003 RepID=A0A1G8J5W8_9BACI|nr:ABC transporter ATP-binding protein [Natribacillus halophilus]SDI26655.1 osmoprotectant transport system ATP-binding protein [Natribacillus halophilus]
MITFKNVSKTFAEETTAVKNLHFHVEKGEFFALIGPSGCGKTTSLKMINRLVEPTEGTVHMEGKDIRDFNRQELRWNIGYVLQQIGLFPTMTVAENIAVVPEMKKWGKRETGKRIDELLEMVGLDPKTFRNRNPDELSGGEQQRVGVVRALAADPDILLMDEPFSALDPISREHLQNDIATLQERIKKTIVFVTHDIEEAFKLADRICLLKDGEALQTGTPRDLQHAPVNDFVKSFVGNRKPDLWETPVSEVMETDSKHMTRETTLHAPSYPAPLYVFGDERRFLGRLEPSGTVSHELLISPERPLREVVSAVEASEYDAVPVVENEQLVGILSYKNIVAYLYNQRAETGALP